MKKMKVERLAKNKGKYIAYFNPHTGSDVRYAKVIDVVHDQHTLVLEPVGGDNAGEQVHTFYKIGDEVEVYTEEEVVVLVMKYA